MRRVIQPIVEGHGDQAAIGFLLRRIHSELIGAGELLVLPAIRMPKTKLVGLGGMEKAAELAGLKLRQAILEDDYALTLLILDSDEDFAYQLGPKLTSRMVVAQPHVPSYSVVVSPEFETWFAASAETLFDRLLDPGDRVKILDPEGNRLGKGWIKDRCANGRYGEVIDQPRLTNRMDLNKACERSMSFRRLVSRMSDLFRTP